MRVVERDWRVVEVRFPTNIEEDLSSLDGTKADKFRVANIMANNSAALDTSNAECASSRKIRVVEVV